METQTETLEVLWDRYCCRLLAFIRRRVTDARDAEDLLQEVFIRIHRGLCCLWEGKEHVTQLGAGSIWTEGGGSSTTTSVAAAAARASARDCVLFGLSASTPVEVP